MSNEIWKDIPSLVDYQASNLGNIRSVDRIVPTTSKTGTPCFARRKGKVLSATKKSLYPQVNIGGVKYVHRLVALAFLSNPERKREVNHKNGNKHDNRIENLEWATPSENISHAYNTNLNHTGQNHVHARLSEDDIKEIAKLYETTDLLQREIAAQFGVTQPHISDILKGDRWKRVTK